MELNNNSNKYLNINDVENRVIDNLNRLIEHKGISQNSLVQIIKKKSNIDIGQGTISKIFSHKQKRLGFVQISLICEALDISINDIMSEKMIPSKLINIKEEVVPSNNLIEHVFEKNEFDKYIGKFFCYFYPTIADERDKYIIVGELDFNKNSVDDCCDAKFKLKATPLDSDINESIEKEYKGKLIFSEKYHCFYCYLYNTIFGELSFLMFDFIKSNNKTISSVMALALTPSAGNNRDATCHRMFMCRKRLSQQGLDKIKPHLKLNNSNILISEKNLKKALDELNVNEEFAQIIMSLDKPELYYNISEHHFLGFSDKQMSGYDKYEFICKLREYAYATYYQKVSEGLNEMLHQFLFKSNNSNANFEDE